MELYSQMLDSGGKAYGEILRHVRDRPSEGALFHCTGIDRFIFIVTHDMNEYLQLGKTALQSSLQFCLLQVFEVVYA